MIFEFYKIQYLVQLFNYEYKNRLWKGYMIYIDICIMKTQSGVISLYTTIWKEMYSVIHMAKTLIKMHMAIRLQVL